MKPAVKPADIALPAWLQRIGEDRIERIQTTLAEIHNSFSGIADVGYAPLWLAFDAVALELSGDPEFERLYFRIQRLVVDLAKQLGWIPPDWLTQFNPDRALPHLQWEVSISRTRSGEPWRGAYRDLLVQSASVRIKETRGEVVREVTASSRPGHQADVSTQLKPVLDVEPRRQKPEAESINPEPTIGPSEASFPAASVGAGSIIASARVEQDLEYLLEGKSWVQVLTAAKYLNKTPDHIRRLVRQKKLASLGHGRPIKVSTAALRKYNLE